MVVDGWPLPAWSAIYVRSSSCVDEYKPKKKIPYRPGAQWPIGARGTKGDWHLPMIANLQYLSSFVKKIISQPKEFFVVSSVFLLPMFENYQDIAILGVRRSHGH